MNQSTVAQAAAFAQAAQAQAQAMAHAQLIEARAALRAEAVAEGLTNRGLAKIIRVSESMVGKFFQGLAHSKRVEARIRKEIDRRREKRLAKEAAKAGAA